MSAANRPENRPRRAEVASECTQNESKHIIEEPLAVTSGCYGQPGTVLIDSILIYSPIQLAAQTVFRDVEPGIYWLPRAVLQIESLPQPSEVLTH